MSKFLDDLDIDELNVYEKNKRVWLLETSYSEKTIETYWRLMSSNVLFREEAKRKDLYDFTKIEIIEIIRGITEEQYQRSMFSAINSYMVWACKRGFNYVGNPCDTISINDIVTVDVNAKKQSYQTLGEFYKFIDDLKCSDVDKMMLVLLRYGVKFNLVADIKTSDVNRDEMKLQVYTSKYVLNYPIDEMFLEWVDKANNLSEYGGFDSLKIKVNPATYSDSNVGYLLRNTIRYGREPENEKVNINTLYTRLNAISANNMIVKINPSELNRARKFDFLFRAYELNKDVDTDDVRKVIDMFDGQYTSAKVVKIRGEFEIISDIKVTLNKYGIEAIQRQRGIKVEKKKEKRDIFS